MKQKTKLKRYEYQEAYRKQFDEGWGVREIARYLGRSPSTISRLFRRYIHPCPGIWRRMTSYEKAMYAWEKSQRRVSQSRKRQRLKSERIRKIVMFILRKWHWSPESISGFLRRFGVFISAKAIYNFIKQKRVWLTEYLRQRGKPRRQRVTHRRSRFRTGVPEKKSIHLRPDIRLEAGHWEIDTIHSRKGTSGGILTLREQYSKRTFYFLVKDLTARTINGILFPFFQSLPSNMRKTLTSDNGSEFAELYKLEKIIDGFQVYYCDPYKAYQRGSVENANGVLRWFFPKKTDFSEVSSEELEKAEYKINSRPMKLHSARSAHAVFNSLLQTT